MVWSDDRLPNAVSDVWLVESADGGRTFTAPVRVSDTPTAPVDHLTYGTGYAWNPSVAVVDDVVYVGWQDFRPLTATDRLTRRNHVRVASSRDGTTFGGSRIVALPPPGAQPYDPALATLPAAGGAWICVWTEADASGAFALRAGTMTRGGGIGP